METIKIEALQEGKGGWLTILAEGNKVFSLGPGRDFKLQEGKSYNITTVWKKNIKGVSKAYILDAKPADGTEDPIQSETPNKPPLRQFNGHSDNIDKLSEAKNETMKVLNERNTRAKCLESANLMVTALLNTWVGNKSIEAHDINTLETMARNLKHSEFIDNLKLCNVELTDDDKVGF